MGLCQGGTCARLTARILAEETNMLGHFGVPSKNRHKGAKKGNEIQGSPFSN